MMLTQKHLLIQSINAVVVGTISLLNFNGIQFVGLLLQSDPLHYNVR